MKAGYHDAMIQMEIQQMRDGVIELAKRNGGWDNLHIQELEESLNQIQERMKIEDGKYNGANIKQEVKDFMVTVENMGEALPREKAPLIAAAKQLEVTLTIE